MTRRSTDVEFGMTDQRLPEPSRDMLLNQKLRESIEGARRDEHRRGGAAAILAFFVLCGLIAVGNWLFDVLPDSFGPLIILVLAAAFTWAGHRSG